jgi:hypothetical protein
MDAKPVKKTTGPVLEINRGRGVQLQWKIGISAVENRGQTPIPVILFCTSESEVVAQPKYFSSLCHRRVVSQFEKPDRGPEALQPGGLHWRDQDAR